MERRQQIRFCKAKDGVRLAFATTGRGPPLIKVGNWLSHLEYDFSSPVWGHLLEMLSARHTVLRYDQRGTGLSDRNVDTIDFESWVDDLETVVNAAGVGCAPILGISQGVPIAIAYAARHPERVSRLVLHGGYSRGRRRRGGGTCVDEESETFARFAELGWERTDSSFRQFFTNQFLPDAPVAQQRWFNELSLLSVSGATTGRMIREFDRIDVSDLLEQVNAPTLVLHANGDLRVPFSEGRLIAARIRDAQFVALDSKYHLMIADDPAWIRWVGEVNHFLGSADIDETIRRVARLTAREHELLDLMAQGRDNAQLAATLHLSDNTVRNHITNIFAKLEADNRARAIAMARDAGLGSG
ncbi:alpha/beta fold hydrolase [Variovorax sp. J31P207]|uniref:alpha/beta fold hydrolase n=1 Tax=Variovorax sp. J31P207 TaxID=3053510 RepID=UPI002576279E|nr:alpha/beta fold hydrolase [Variovorax sp. J31P207]MDM0066610.1 alpha/beta fold hydrolase [Variovorax sp. J31P207]